jgi:predicted enzyme related to lactoylglutathione lyase
MNRVTHFEIYTNDPEGVQPFYQNVFGWKFQKFEGGPVEYWLVTTGDDKEPGINGGLTRPREGQSPGTINTIAVGSVDQTIKKIEQVADKFACRRWRFQKSAGSPMPPIQPATCLESSNRTQKQNNRRNKV